MQYLLMWTDAEGVHEARGHSLGAMTTLALALVHASAAVRVRLYKETAAGQTLVQSFYGDLSPAPVAPKPAPRMTETDIKEAIDGWFPPGD